MARGLGLGQALNAFTTGAQQGLEFVNAVDARKQRMEDRQLAMVDRQRRLQQEEKTQARQKELQARQDKEYQDEQTGNFLAEQKALHIAGLPTDGERLKSFGINPAKHFSPEFDEHVAKLTEAEAGKIDYRDKGLIKTINWRYSDQINKGVGTEVGSSMRSTDGVTVPAGTRIDTKELHALEPGKGKGGKFAAMLKMTGTTPDGKKITWLNPANADRSTNQNNDLLAIDFKQMLQDAQGDMLLSEGMNDKQFIAMVDAKLAGLGKAAPKDEMAKERLKADTELEKARIGATSREKVAQTSAGATRYSADVRAKAVGGRGGAAGKGGTDQQFIKDIETTLFSDVSDPKERRKLAEKHAISYYKAKGKNEPKSETIRKIAKDLTALKDKKDKPLYANYDDALKKAEEVYGSLTARFDREPDEEAADAGEYIRKPDEDADIYDLLGGE